MTRFRFMFMVFCLLAIVFVTAGMTTAQEPTAPATEPTVTLNWDVVVNNADYVPGDARMFNSYNQPSININNVVVFRARSKGGNGTGEPAHGVYQRDMASEEGVVSLFDRNTLVPQPNSEGSTFIEPPAFPRIDMWSKTFASRANHQPVLEYVIGTDSTGAVLTTKAGTTGLYTNPYGLLISGANNLGNVPGFGFFAVPGHPGLKFDVFPGAPAVANSNTLVFKGNFTVDAVGKTGVYYRTLGAGEYGGTSLVVRIADSDRVIPKSKPETKFGSTAPPSAAMRGKNPTAIFAGFDNEETPTMGGLYSALLTGQDPELKALVKIGTQVPGEAAGVGFNKIGEGVSFDGRFVGFWAAWGTETKTLTLFCPKDGNKDRIAFCKGLYGDPEENPGVPGSVSYGYQAIVPVHQGMFVYDMNTGQIRVLAKTPTDFADFVYWNFSGLVPGTGESDEDGEPARWRSASFIAVSGLVDGKLEDANFHAAFKGRKGSVENGAYVNPIDGIYIRKGPDTSPILPLVTTGMPGVNFDPESEVEVTDEITGETLMVKLPVTEMGIERDGFRGRSLAINISFGTEEAGFAGIYLTKIPNY